MRSPNYNNMNKKQQTRKQHATPALQPVVNPSDMLFILKMLCGQNLIL